MKSGHSMLGQRGAGRTALSILFCLLAAPVSCPAVQVAMLLATQPGQGGFVNPRQGVYSFDPDSQIILTAAAKPGYEFVCWLGDVSDRTAARTIAHLDKPKIIVAVFERADYDIEPTPESVSGGRTGNGGYPGTPPIPTPGPAVSAPWSWPSPPKGRVEQIPEPSSFLLFALAAVMLRNKR
jgi:hypothetical protein